MGTLTIYYYGICTHLWQSDSSGPHRTVVVNARGGDGRIAPHFPRLSIKADDIISGEPPQLDGVTITVRDRNPKQRYHPSYERCIPRLIQFTKMRIDLDPDAIDGLHPARTAGLIVAHGGDWRAGRDEMGAATAYVTIETETEHPTLRVEQPDEIAPYDVVLRSGAVVLVSNTGLLGRGRDDEDYDFLLHFRVAKSTPTDASWPTEKDLHCEKLPLSGISNTVGPGCSNSNYP